jgi:hypothetical protein
MAAIPVSWRRAWPIVGLVLALLVNVAWIGALAYGLSKLL